MLKGISGILRVNSVAHIPPIGNPYNKPQENEPMKASTNSFADVLNKTLQNESIPSSRCETFTYGADSLYHDFLYAPKEYTY
jgi:hypothetical protein